MRNLVLIFATLLCVYLYNNPRVETRVEPARPVPIPPPVPVVRATPTAPSTVYYHSPLDAGAMSTSASTGSGYFSSDPNSRFRGVYYGGYNGYNASSYYGPTYSGYPYYPAGGGGVVSNSVTYNLNNGGGAAASARTSPPAHYTGRPYTPPPTRSTNR